MKICDIKSSQAKGLYRESILIDRQYALGDLARLLQRTTENAMAALGIDISILKRKGLIWVLCFSEYRIRRMPSEGETLEICSWPGKERFNMYSRKYALNSPDGECLITCASLFSAVDRNTRKMTAPSDVGFVFPVLEFPDEPALPKMTEKGIATPLEQQHAVSIHEIDRNEHVNNSFYLDWAENLLGDSAEPPDRPVRRIWISYLKEIRMGETVKFQYGKEADTLFIKGLVGNEHCFKALLSI